MKGTPSLGPWPRTHVIRATDIWLGLMVDLVPSLRSSASSCGWVGLKLHGPPLAPPGGPSAQVAQLWPPAQP